MLPKNRVTDITGFTDKTVVEVLVGKHPPERKPHCSMLQEYQVMPIFIPVDFTEDLVESVSRSLTGISGPGGTDLGALQGWILKFGTIAKKSVLRLNLSWTV